MNWTIRKADDDAKKFQELKFIYFLAVISAIVMVAVFRNIVYPLLGLVVLFVSTSEFFLGKKYSLDEKVAKSGANEITWPLVKSVHISENQIYLSPFEAESKLDAFRGVKLNIQNVSKESVLEYVRQHVGKDVRFLGE
ncbi:MAG: hypothetical protein WCG75_00520 [Armatimonadota bacterium]